MPICKFCIQLLLWDQLPSRALTNTEPGFSGWLPVCTVERDWFVLVHQEGDLCAPIRLWQRGLPCLGLFFPVYQQALFTHTHTLADMASCVALGYQTIKEWDYNGGRPLEEKGKERKREGVWRRQWQCLRQGRGCTVAELMALFPLLPPPRARALPKSEWEEQQRTPTPGYQGCRLH